MRKVYIDLSSDYYLQQVKIFGGYAGEHNETILQVKLPKRMIDIECSGYRFDFQTSEDNKISSPLIPVSKLNNGILSFHLTQQLTIAGKLLFNVVAILSDENTVSMISKTNTVTLRIEDTADGNMQFIDPNGYKDELQKMVDERIKEINSASVDQIYIPDSEKSQSGKAVAQAIENLRNELSYVPIEIKTFTANPNQAEIGSTVKSVTLNWTLNKSAKLLKLDDENVGILTSGSKSLTGLNLTSNKTWILRAADEKSATSSKTVSLSFLKGIYYGTTSATAEITNDLILGLTRKLQSAQNINQTFTVTPTNSQKVVFALPTKDYNDPVFKIGGFEYTWEKVKEFELTNLSGYKEDYTVWRSVQVVANTLNITVTATKK